MRIFTGVEVTGIDLHDGQVESVETDAGSIDTELVIAGAGPWSGHVWRMLSMWPSKMSGREDRVPRTPESSVSPDQA